PHPPLHRVPGPGPRVHLPARRLPGLAPTSRVGAIDVHRRATSRRGRPRRSQGADTKAATKTTTDDQPAHSFTALLDHLAALTRNRLRVAGHDQSGFDLLAIPTPTGRRAFELLDAPIPLTLKYPEPEHRKTVKPLLIPEGAGPCQGLGDLRFGLSSTAAHTSRWASGSRLGRGPPA